MNTLDSIVYVPLSRGKVAIIDACDWRLVSGYRWHAMPGRNETVWYASTTIPRTADKAKGHMAMHIMLMGAPFVDHIDGNGLNNRRSNLRFATRSQNRQNSSAERQTLHGMKGVDFMRSRGQWRARIFTDGKRLHLGAFQTSEEAGRAYDKAARQYFGEFARLNFPD